MVLLWVKPARGSQNVPKPQFSLQQNAHFWWLDTWGKPAVCSDVHKHGSERLKPTDATTQWLRAKLRRLPADKRTKLVSYTRFRTFHSEWDASHAICAHYRLNTSLSSTNKSRSLQLLRWSSKSPPFMTAPLLRNQRWGERALQQRQRNVPARTHKHRQTGWMQQERRRPSWLLTFRVLRTADIRLWSGWRSRL